MKKIRVAVVRQNRQPTTLTAIAEKENKPVNDPEQLPTLGSRSKRTVRPPNRLGFGRIVPTARLDAMVNQLSTLLLNKLYPGVYRYSRSWRGSNVANENCSNIYIKL